MDVYSFPRLFVLLLLFVYKAHAQQEPTLSITGEVQTPLTLRLSDLKAMEQVTYTANDREGTENRFKGVPLVELLRKAGVTTGRELRGENLVKYVLVSAADGYEVLYALPEIDPDFTDQVIFLALEKNDAALPASEGPFRMIVPNDKRPARWVREVRHITVRFAPR